MGRVCVGRLCYGPSLQWAEFAMGRDVQLPIPGDMMPFAENIFINLEIGVYSMRLYEPTESFCHLRKSINYKSASFDSMEKRQQEIFYVLF